MGQHTASGIKVLDRTVAILTAVSGGPLSLAELCDTTGLPRATVHRLATALKVHGFLERTSAGHWTIGAALTSLGGGATDRLIDAAGPILNDLVELTGESAQLYELTGTTRTCMAAREPVSGLQNTVPVGSEMPLTAGSAARVFAAYGPPDIRAASGFAPTELDWVRERGWAESVSEREVGLASVSAPVLRGGLLVAALSVSGVAERLRPSPGALWGGAVTAAAKRLAALL